MKGYRFLRLKSAGVGRNVEALFQELANGYAKLKGTAAERMETNLKDDALRSRGEGDSRHKLYPMSRLPEKSCSVFLKFHETCKSGDAYPCIEGVQRDCLWQTPRLALREVWREYCGDRKKGLYDNTKPYFSSTSCLCRKAGKITKSNLDPVLEVHA